MSARQAPPGTNGKLRTSRLVRVVLCFVILYVGSYFALSRYSLEVLEGNGVCGFYYVPCSGDTLTEYRGLEELHQALVLFYYPIWALDHYLLGGPYWAGIPMHGVE